TRSVTFVTESSSPRGKIKLGASDTLNEESLPPHAPSRTRAGKRRMTHTVIPPGRSPSPRQAEFTLRREARDDLDSGEFQRFGQRTARSLGSVNKGALHLGALCCARDPRGPVSESLVVVLRRARGKGHRTFVDLDRAPRKLPRV